MKPVKRSPDALPLPNEQAKEEQVALTDLLLGNAGTATANCGVPVKLHTFASPLGRLVAVASDTQVYACHFLVGGTGRQVVQRVLSRQGCVITSGKNSILEYVEQQVTAYFLGHPFKQVPSIVPNSGTVFQQAVWQTLSTIPVGETVSYQQIAKWVGKPAACRAVGQALGANPLVLFYPCHRVICANGSFGAYSGLATRKAWLLAHEQTNRIDD